MSFTDIATLVTPTYDAVIPVPDDGELLTEVVLRGCLQPIANRVEFLRDLVPDAADSPEFFATLREDFLELDHNSSRSTLYGTVPWTAVMSGSGSGGIAIGHLPGTSKNPGGLSIGTPGTLGDANFALYLGPAVTSAPLTFASVQSLTIVAKIVSDTSTLLTPSYRCGLSDTADFPNGGADSLGLFYSTALGANWLLLRRVAGVQTTTVLTPMVFGEYVTVKFQKNAALGFDVFVNGALVTTVALASLPGGGCTLSINQAISTVEGATALSTVTDLIVLRSQCGARDGV
jgi:hypothetical protein